MLLLLGVFSSLSPGNTESRQRGGPGEEHVGDAHPEEQWDGVLACELSTAQLRGGSLFRWVCLRP